MGRHVQIFRIEFDADYFICVKVQPELLGEYNYVQERGTLIADKQNDNAWEICTASRCTIGKL